MKKKNKKKSVFTFLLNGTFKTEGKHVWFGWVGLDHIIVFTMAFALEASHGLGTTLKGCD